MTERHVVPVELMMIQHFDFANVECSGATDDDAVWYTFTPGGCR